MKTIINLGIRMQDFDIDVLPRERVGTTIKRREKNICTLGFQWLLFRR